MVYEMDSKSIVRKGVRVRVPPPAPSPPHHRPATGGPILSRPMSESSIQKSLAEIADRLTKAQAELRIVEEQLLYQTDLLEDAKTRMLVSETPLADRVFRDARDDHENLARQRERAEAEITDLRREQDRLLDRMLGSRA